MTEQTDPNYLLEYELYGDKTIYPTEYNGFVSREKDVTLLKPHLKNPPPVKSEEVTIQRKTTIEPQAKSPLNDKTLEEQFKEFMDKISSQDMSTRQKAIAEVIMNLVMQMGTSQELLGQGKVDMRILSVLNEQEQVSLGHFNYRGNIDKIRYFQNLVDWILTTSPSINGLGRRQVIQLTGAYSGGSVQDLVQKPGWFARNTYKKGWEKDAEKKGAKVVE